MKEALLNQARIFTMAGQEILPLLRESENDAYMALLAAFKEGKKDLLPEVARLDALYNLIADIESKIELYNHELTKEQHQ